MDPWVRKIPWRRERLPTLGFLPGAFHGWRSLVEYRSHRVRHNQATNKPLHLPLPGLFLLFSFAYTDLAFCFGFWPASACKALFSVSSASLSLSCIGEGNGNPLQCSCLENPRDGGAWWAAIYGVAQSRTRLKQLSSSSSSSCLLGLTCSVMLGRGKGIADTARVGSVLCGWSL